MNKITIKEVSIQFINSLKQILNGICEIIIGIYYILGCFILLLKLMQNKKDAQNSLNSGISLKNEKQTGKNTKKAKKKE